MKRIVCFVIIIAALFAGCSKNEDLTSGNKVTITNEKVANIDPTCVEISGTYSYLSNLDGIYVLVSTSSDMANAKAFESVLSGKEFTATVTELNVNTKYYYKYRFVSMGGELESNDVKSFTTPPSINGHVYVDLDLPSGLLWATCNVGAENPEDYGDYFAWGETTTNSAYGWYTYKWCNGSYNTLTKYNTNSSYGVVDNKTELELTDDAAHVNWDGGWRIPTKSEMEELKNNCNWTWTKMEGKSGYRVASTSDNNKYIFLPAAGYYDGSSLHDAGSFGHYWSSSLGTGYSYYAIYLYFNYLGNVDMNGNKRYYGQSVRPVYQLPK